VKSSATYALLPHFADPQGLGIAELPPEIADKSQLTRLDLMCNHLEASRKAYITLLTHVRVHAGLLATPA
jgi:hypothetical protein